VKAWGNGRDELAFPAPEKAFIRLGFSQANVTGFLEEDRSSSRIRSGSQAVSGIGPQR